MFRPEGGAKQHLTNHFRCIHFSFLKVSPLPPSTPQAISCETPLSRTSILFCLLDKTATLRGGVWRGVWRGGRHTGRKGFFKNSTQKSAGSIHHVMRSFLANIWPKMPKNVTSHDVLEPSKQVLSLGRAIHGPKAV